MKEPGGTSLPGSFCLWICSLELGGLAVGPLRGTEISVKCCSDRTDDEPVPVVDLDNGSAAPDQTIALQIIECLVVLQQKLGGKSKRCA